MTDTPETAAPPRRAGGPAAPPGRATTATAWAFYALIVLEILFMVSPVAAYYYAVYGVPLNALAGYAPTAWLVQHVLPHFSISTSPLVRVLIGVSWPLILLGLAGFAVGFVQIYRAHFTGRGAVVGGLYRYVRHPQYTALALVGLGTTLFWSRFLVVAAFAAMLCLYGALARLEERRCLVRYGEPYRRYMADTGRFLPARLERWASGLLPRLPADGWARTTAFTGACIAVMGAALGSAVWLRHHALASLDVAAPGNHAVLFLAPLEGDRRTGVLEHIEALVGDQQRVIYVAPGAWRVPELGLAPPAGYDVTASRELAHPTSHGNTAGYDTGIQLLVARPVTRSAAAGGRALLAATVRVEPLSGVLLDSAATSASPRRQAASSDWGDVPVPVY